MRNAYGVGSIVLPNVLSADGSGQTIAIVDAYDNPNAFADLQKFDQQFGLADPPSFQKVSETGGSSLPGTNAGWGLESALDVEWAHSIAPNANIILYEANSSSLNDLFTAVNTAKAAAGVCAVSMSFSTSGDFGSEASFDSTFTSTSQSHGVTFFGATGDSGGTSGYPATSPDVVAVGGTSLSTDSAGDHLGESLERKQRLAVERGISAGVSEGCGYPELFPASDSRHCDGRRPQLRGGRL